MNAQSHAPTKALPTDWSVAPSAAVRYPPSRFPQVQIGSHVMPFSDAVDLYEARKLAWEDHLSQAAYEESGVVFRAMSRAINQAAGIAHKRIWDTPKQREAFERVCEMLASNKREAA